ncbi:MAG: hypothetical protein QM755_16720, partial [Luteolibacter sp.]
PALTGHEVIVTGAYPLFRIRGDIGDEEFPALDVDGSGLKFPTGRTGSISLNTIGIAELLAGSAAKNAIFEIEVYDPGAGTAWTAAQLDVQIKDDVIPGSPTAPIPIPGIGEMAVLHSAVQSLSNTSRWRALGNVGFAWDDGKLVLLDPDGNAVYVPMMTYTPP